MKAPRLFLPCALLSLAVAAAAQQPSPPAPPPPACQSPEFRQFDFWIGSWTVTDEKNQQAGTSEISRVSDGCAIREQWQGNQAPAGTSLNYYDKTDGAWHQIWVGGGGAILHLKGGLQGNVMVLTGDDRKTPRGTVRDRLRWTPQSDGGVIQEWDISPDGGKTWQTSFTGRYRKR